MCTVSTRGERCVRAVVMYERVCACQSESLGVGVTESVCVCVCIRECVRESESVCMFVYAWVLKSMCLFCTFLFLLRVDVSVCLDVSVCV